jgi:C4-dicarboxylate-specific signal transduction histidine kinase
MIYGLRVAAGAVFSLSVSALGWASVLISDSSSGLTTSVLAPATALTATSGALVYVVRLIASGRLVHRDSAAANDRLREALHDATEARKASARREDLLLEALTARRRDST